MSTGYQIKDQEQAYYLTLQVVNWIDVFTRKRYRDILIESVSYCQKEKGLIIYAYVIMSNHVHMLVRSDTGRLSDTIRDLKRHTSKTILQQIEAKPESRREWMLSQFKHAATKHKRNNEYQFWTHENHAEHIYSNKFIEQKIDYIHNNPVRSGIVEDAAEYIYSSAKNYVGEKGILEVGLLALRWKTYT